jgi:hemerythrin-like metal-binding protein
MPRLEWKEEYGTGIDSVDYEHRQIIETINQTCEALAQTQSTESVLDCLGLLYQRICAHFALEENLMRKAGYHMYSVHKAEHDRLLERIRDMMDAFENGACDTCGKTLEECLLNWFEQHFHAEDGQSETAHT